MNLNAWLIDTITVASVSGQNSHGDPTFGAQVSVAARVEPVQRRVRTPSGQEVIADIRILTATKIKYNDRIWVPGASTANATQSRVPISVQQSSTKAGAFTLYEVLL